MWTIWAPCSKLHSEGKTVSYGQPIMVSSVEVTGVISESNELNICVDNDTTKSSELSMCVQGINNDTAGSSESIQCVNESQSRDEV